MSSVSLNHYTSEDFSRTAQELTQAVHEAQRVIDALPRLPALPPLSEDVFFEERSLIEEYEITYGMILRTLESAESQASYNLLASQQETLTNLIELHKSSMDCKRKLGRCNVERARTSPAFCEKLNEQATFLNETLNVISKRIGEESSQLKRSEEQCMLSTRKYSASRGG